MRRFVVAMLGSVMTCAALECAAAEQPEKAWIERSNDYTNQFVEVQLRHSPEEASHEGVAKFDEFITDPTLADDMAQRHELEAVLKKIDAARAKETDKKVLEDLEILHKAFDLNFRQQDYELKHEVTFYNASEIIFHGLRTLLDD